MAPAASLRWMVKVSPTRRRHWRANISVTVTPASPSVPMSKTLFWAGVRPARAASASKSASARRYCSAKKGRRGRPASRRTASAQAGLTPLGRKETIAGGRSREGMKGSVSEAPQMWMAKKAPSPVVSVSAMRALRSAARVRTPRRSSRRNPSAAPSGRASRRSHSASSGRVRAISPKTASGSPTARNQALRSHGFGVKGNGVSATGTRQSAAKTPRRTGCAARQASGRTRRSQGLSRAARRRGTQSATPAESPRSAAVAAGVTHPTARPSGKANGCASTKAASTPTPAAVPTRPPTPARKAASHATNPPSWRAVMPMARRRA